MDRSKESSPPPESEPPSAPMGNNPRLRLAFLAWTVVVLIALWWLMERGSEKPDLLIALDSPRASSWTERTRLWLSARVEAHWFYPWVLFGPYVFWMGLRVAMERRGWPWRLGAHCVAATVFVMASQALASRLDTLRPRLVVISREEVVREFDEVETNRPAKLPPSAAPQSGNEAVLTRNPRTKTVAKIESSTTNYTDRPVTRNRTVVVRTEYSTAPENTPLDLPTSTQANTREADDEAHRLAKQLAPLIEQRIHELPPPSPADVSRRLSGGVHVMAYLALAGLAQAWQFRRRLEEREHHALRLESKLSESRLRALQSQLQPHFLFNTLNGIATLVRRDARAAEEMLTSLSDLLRLSLAHSGKHEIPLREELQFLDRYLGLQRMRFADRLTVEQRIDNNTLDCLVPSLLLQPLVENAIRHGIEPAPRSGCIRLSARRTPAGRLELRVEDDGLGVTGGREPSSRSGTGLGLATVRGRLAGLYGDRHVFEARGGASGGFIVTIEIPVRLAATDHEPGTT